MSSIGVLLIVKNEEKCLDRCLKSVADWADQIVIVDSGSVDGTLDISKKYTNDVYIHSQWEGFGRQRQIAQGYLKTDWVFVIDADEEVSPELKRDIILTVGENSKKLYLVNRLSSAFGKRINYSGWSPDWIVRLYPRELAGYNDALVHEKVISDSSIDKGKLRGYLFHDTYSSLNHYSLKTTKYLKAWADEREGKKSSSISKSLLHAFSCFIKMYFIKLGFLDGRHGFILAWLAAHSTFYKYIDLWLREYEKNES
ncbi:glycosyltransferase family 2 protein [Marinomonas posidonica]|uniref:Glycosyl transferase family 2 n=1 Tax=Marinomonas posidonica (strain CECT 7376 / NCIMB 14433 / IVIA-Po-181) TaxID=491952 RepID=F6CS40_MARPP|nr:glycosyltransferase family 2 protein [Marinomonas posidonica]AEF53827.1 glycosyl transferase family 2 [Marinomonas posidonica IVIA-Po-181]